MKITKLLLWISYLGFAGCIIAFGFLGYFLLIKDFNPQEAEKGSLEGVVSKSTTGKFNLPMNLDVEYYFRVKDGEVLVDGYFLKIQKKFLEGSVLPDVEKNENDYPKAINGNLYSMPDSDSFLYISIPFSSFKSTLTIWKIYFIMAFSFLLMAIFLTIKFLQNCNKELFFIPENATYIRMISYLAIGYSLIDYGTQWLIFKGLNSKFEEFVPINLNSELEFNWKYLIFSFFLVITAQAFTEGTKLKEEQSLTI